MAGGGYFINIISYDKNGPDINGAYEFSTEYFFDPSVTARLEMSYTVSKSMQVLFFIAPVYSYFFEENSTGQIYGGEFGIRMMF